MAAPTPTGELAINEGTGPFHYGDTLTFTTTADKERGGTPMVEVCLFQDFDLDGDIERGLFNGDLVWVALNQPDRAVVLGHGGEDLDHAQSSLGWARLLLYTWKGRQETITELDRADFEAGP